MAGRKWSRRAVGRYAGIPAILLLLPSFFSFGGTTVALGAPVAAEEPSLGLSLGDAVKLKGYYRFRYGMDLEEDSDLENTTEWRNDLRVETKTILGRESNIQLSFDAQVDRVDSPVMGNRTEKDELQVWEAYLKTQYKSVDLWLGRQVIRWGKSDELNPTDNFTPEDFSEWASLDRADRKIPVWMARGKYYGEGWGYELILLPFFEPSPGISRESDWYPTALRGAEALGLGIRETEPEKSSKNFVWANKLNYVGSSFDLGLSYAYHFNEIAALHIQPPEAVYGYGRQHSVGMDFEAVQGEWGFRGEGVYTTDEWFPTQDPAFPDGTEPKDIVSAIVGTDHTFAGDIYVNLQFWMKYIVGYADSLQAEEFDSNIIWNVSRKFFREDLELALSGRYQFDPEGYFITPEAKYRVNDFVRLRVFMNLLGGDDASMFGQYDANDQTVAEVKLLW